MPKPIFDKLATAFTSHKTPSDQLGHLMTCFGYAAYEAQSLEGSLVILTATSRENQGETSTQKASQRALKRFKNDVWHPVARDQGEGKSPVSRCPETQGRT